MRTVKVLAALVGGIIALGVAGLLAVWFLVNPNDYKGRIGAGVKQSTGRELSLTGDIKLSVFPWIALELGPAALSNPPGFNEEPFLAFNRAAIRVKLKPLLHGELEIQRIELDGLDLRLRKNSAGVGNWQDFGKADSAKATPEPKAAPASLPQLDGIKISNGRVSYQGVVIEHFNLESGALGHQGTVPLSVSFDANRGVPEENVSVNAKFNLSTDSNDQDFKFAAVSLSGLVGRTGDARASHWELSAPSIELDLVHETLSIPSFTAGYSSAHLTGTLQATKISSDLSATGSVALAPLVLHEIAPRLGVTLPKTRDPRALAQFAASSDFEYGAGGVHLDKLQAQLDDTHLKGSAAVTGEAHALKFALTVDQIDVSRYLSAEQAPTAAPKKAADSAHTGTTAKLPEAEGTLTIGAVHFAPLDFTNVRVTLASHDNVMRLFPAQAQIDGGNYSGNVSVDNRGAAPVLGLDEHLSGVDMTRLLAGTSYKGRMSGRGNVNLKASAHGSEMDAVMQSLNGRFDANLADGAIEGVDLGYEIGLAESLLKHTAAPAQSKPPRTKFDAFKMSADIVNGVATTKDLMVSSAVMKLTGQGSANLVSKAIDYRMNASILKAPGAALADIPLSVTGTYLDPKVRPDVSELAKGELKQKLQDVLKKNGLEGLFKK